MSLRVVFFNRSFYPDITATSQLLAELCEDLVKDYDCRITVIAGRPLIREGNSPDENFGIKIIRRENFKEIEILRVRNTTFSFKYFLGRISNYLTYFFYSFIASFKLKRPDLVITLTDPPIICLTGWLTSLRFHIPFIISVRDIFPEAALGLNTGRIKIINFLLDYINRFCLKKANHIVTLGKIMEKRLIERKGIREDRVSVISDWANCSRISPLPKRNIFSLDHNLADSFVVMYSGNMGVSSGLETIAECAIFLKDYRDILFVFIGEGIMKDKIVKFTKLYNLGNTKFFPYQPKELLSNSFSSADIFVIPLKRGLAGYSLPSKIYPILASGRPYVACIEEESEVAQITQQFNCGLIAKPQNPQDLSSKILFFYKNKEEKIKMGLNARRAATSFDQSLGIKSYYELFKRIHNHKKDF